MKKILYTICLISACLSLHAQIIFQEDFDGVAGPTAGGAGTYSFPSGWLLRNVDNRTAHTSVGYVNDAWERREDFNFSVLDSCAFSTSWYTPFGQADDWMWTPAINVTDNCILRWNAVTYDGEFPDGYEVRIMVSPNVPTGGTGVLGNQVSASTLLFSIAAENTSWTTRMVDLSAYEDETVYIGFRNNTNDQFLLLIDDVIVERVLDYDARLVSTDKIEYSQVPANQEREFLFSGTIDNLGSFQVTDVTLQVNVFDESNMNVFSVSSPTWPALDPNDDVNLATSSPFIPAIPGVYRVHYEVDIAETDDQPANDTTSRYLTISDTIYARDEGALTNQIGIGAGNGGYVGQEFRITAESVLSSISMYSNNFPGGPSQLGAALFRIVGGVPQELPFYTFTPITIEFNASPQWYVFEIPGGQILEENDTILIAAQEIDSTLRIGQTNQIFTPGTVWVDWPSNPFGTWANVEQFGQSFSKALMIRANIHVPTCDDGVQNGDEAGVDCGGSCPPCGPPDAHCGVITVYVNPASPVYDGPGANNIWWIPVEDLDAGSTSAYMSPDLDVRRHLSTLTFDWTTAGACIDFTPNGGSLNTSDKGTAYKDCLPVRNADFNVWKLYQLRITDPSGSDQCIGTVKVVPQSPALASAPIIHYYIPYEERMMQDGLEYDDESPLPVSEFMISPNPGSQDLNVTWSSGIEENVDLAITDISGNVLVEQSIPSLRGLNMTSFDMSRYLPGVYVVYIQTPVMRTTAKWLKSY